MKATINNLTPDFTPVELVLTLETAAEVRAFGILSNYTPLLSAFRAIGLDLEPIFNELPKGGYSTESWSDDIKPLEDVLFNHPAVKATLRKVTKPVEAVLVKFTVDDI